MTIDDSTLPWPDMDTAQPQLPYDFKAGVADLFSKVGEGAPVTSLADVIAINNEDPANRAPYGQSYLEWSVADELTPEEFARVQATAAALGETWMRTILEQNDVDILVTGMKYSGNAGAAGVPALTIPNGLDPNGRPQGIILSGPYLSDPQLIAVGYALEQALNGRVEPDLDATIAADRRRDRAVTLCVDLMGLPRPIRSTILHSRNLRDSGNVSAVSPCET